MGVTFPERINVRCPNCGSFKTFEDTYNFGRTVTNGIYCGNCGKSFYDGTDSIRIVKNKGTER